jgi:hypothetical protein
VSIAFHVPAWLLWCIGIPLVIAILVFAAFGFVIAKDWSKGGFV